LSIFTFRTIFFYSIVFAYKLCFLSVVGIRTSGRTTGFFTCASRETNIRSISKATL
jgi:hypothetical protein